MRSGIGMRPFIKLLNFQVEIPTLVAPKLTIKFGFSRPFSKPLKGKLLELIR
jgi:hypothetical protein